MAKLTFSLDPGLVNSALVVLDYKKRKVVYQTMVPVAITVLKNEEKDAQTKAFRKWYRKQIKKYKPTAFIAERFQNRGFRGGQSISECVSFMLGHIDSICCVNKVQTKLVSAVVWKNKVNKCFSLEDCYSIGKELKVPPHKIDSLFMNLYLNDYNFNKLRNRKERYFWIKQLIDE